MAEPSRSLRVAIYCRISDDREGERLGVERQRQDCMARAEREGWQVIEVFTDNDISASTKSRKPRPEYKRMIGLAEAGELDVILSYSNSRLTRRPRELLDLIDLHNATGVLLRTVVSGDVDLSTADGRAVAITLAAWDAAEAERISERVARAARQRREQGLRHGGFPPFGYRNAEGGKLEMDPARADVVKEAARRVLAGESLYGVWNDFNRRSIPTAPSTKAPKGARWHGRTLKRVLTVPATIGCVTDDAGNLRHVAEPILDRASWERLRELLYEPTRFDETRKPDWSNRRKYALSGLLFCGLCRHWLSGSTRSPSKRADGTERPRVKTFMCAPATGGCGKLRIDYEPVEAWVTGQVFALVAVPAVQTALSTPQPAGEADELRQRIAEDQRLLERLDDDHADGLLDRARYRRQVERVTRRVDDARARLAEIQRASLVIDTGGRSLRDAWADRAHDASWQRAFLERVIDRVTVMPHPAGVPSTITARRGETAEELAERRREHRDLLLLERVQIKWKAEPLPDVAPDIDMGAFEHLTRAQKFALWVSRMHANRPVQVTDAALVADVAGLVRAPGKTR